jgi:hypothetical protein
MGGVGLPIPCCPHDGWIFFGPSVPVRTAKKIDFCPTMEDPGGTKWTHLPTTRTEQQYMDTWRRKTPRGQLGFPKTRGELRELKEFADEQVRHDHWETHWL